MDEKREMWQRHLGTWLDQVKRREILRALEDYTHYIIEMTDLFVEALDSLIKDKNITIQIDLISEREDEADIDATREVATIIAEYPGILRLEYLSKADAADILDFTISLFERIYTEPKKIELAKERRKVRRSED